MRVREEYKKSGYFWLPSDEDKKIPGTLSITDGGHIELEVVGLFDKSIDAALNGSPHVGRIIGYVEKDGLVTLEDCVYSKKNFAFDGISKSLVYVATVFSGAAYEEDEKVSFNTLSFSVEGIDEWVGASGIKVNLFENSTATITYQPLEEISFNLSNGMQLLISFSWTLPGFPNTTEAKITQKTYFKLISASDRGLDEFTFIAYKITNLLCFAIDKTVCLESLSATSNGIQINTGSGKSKPIPIKIYYQSLPFSKEESKIDSHTMLFRFGQIREDAGKIINNWINAYDNIEPALGLYFSAKTGTQKLLDGRFLALVQGLETYHRRTSHEKLMDNDEFNDLVTQILSGCPAEKKDWLKNRLTHGNEINLRNKIKRIIEPFKEHVGSSKKCKEIISNIVDTRNYLTHYDKPSEYKIVSGGDLLSLCFKMEALFQLHFLQVLGFTKEEIKSVLDNCHNLRQKLNGSNIWK